MTVPTAFIAAYRELEARMRARAEADGDVFLPNPAPTRPVDYVAICMEPSLGRWAASADEAARQVEAGFRNFLSSLEDFILHFSIRAYLCASGQGYHITDLSKGAMLVEAAREARARRYARWYDLLNEEVELVATANAGIVAVGSLVAQQLRRNGFARPFVRVIHYSGQAARARSRAIVGREASFQAFKGSVSLQDLLETAEAVLLSASVPAAICGATLSRLAAKAQLTASREQLLFSYKVAFESFRRRLQFAADTSRPGAV